MGKPRIDDIEAAIIAAIQDDANMSYIPDDQVQTLSQRTVDFAREQIVVVPPAVLLAYTGGAYLPQNIPLTAYSIAERFLLIAVAANTRGAGEAKRGSGADKGVYDILENLKSIFAGRKLTVDIDRAVWTKLVGVTFEGINEAGHFCYGLEIEVGAMTWDYST
jgi:hypothetical protein